ncbi:MAG: hypothetical protein FJ224_10640, partial [Lentisphaerae bacterium]|nr:hypothetical protein [Lentisphaerota bacterium]
MYLKSLEMNGFKSFANRTKLDFEPGLTAIVGPNGCGKSNISDAVRWVLGEMSAKAMRGSSMEDVIFNGTDDHKPLGMAEVSLTLADCENVLATEFNEVTITRRVFRSGEGQYFINKTPCRLRDIHRLFMDTGIGTTSYSMMEQGRIDRILSARPEDRRAVFEEASGITKYKSDKKEAIRKLEHTEANLLRLADVIREVKRQIGSLQRQAGKARRYKDARDELRKLDLYLTGQKLRQADAMIKSISDRAAGWIEQIASGETEVAGLEAKLGSLRETLSSTEHEMSAAHEAQMQAQAGLDHTREMMEMNRQRIDEYRAWTERDTREAADVSAQLAEKEALLRALEARTASCRSEWQEAEAAMKACQARHARQVEAMDAARSLIHKMRDESVQLESLSTRLQNRIVEMDTRERSALIRRERLAAEKSGLTELAAEYERRREEMVLALAGMARDVEAAESELKRVTAEQDAASSSAQAANEELAQARASASAAKAQVDIIEKHRDSLEPFPAGARMLLDAANPLELDSSSLSGALASHVETDPELRIALEAALRAWGDAVVVRDSAAARAILAKLSERGAGAARLVSCEPAGDATEPDDALIHKVSCPAAVRPAVAAALAGVRLADSLDSVPSEIPSGTTWVTRGGAVVRGNCFEHWSAETPTATPLTVKHAADSARAALEAARTAAAAAEARLAECAARIRE